MSGDPTVTSVVASGPGITTSTETGNLNVGAVVTFTVDMSAPVTVSGTPSFTLNDNGGVATYMSGSGSNALIFGYTVAAGQDTPTTGTPGLAITGYVANGATVSSGNPTITPGSGQTLVASDGTFSFGGATGGGNYVILRNGSQYASGAAALLELVNTTVWAETASNQWYEDNGANWSSSTTAPPSGGTVQTASLTNLNTFAFPNLVINTTSPPPPSGPTVTSVVASGPGITTSNETGDLNVGAVVTFTVDMSAPVTVSGTPSFTLNDNGGVATYMSGSGSNALIFGYTVAAGQDTPTTGTPGLAITGYVANGATVSTGNPTITPGSGQTLVASDGTFSFGGATGGGNYVILRNGSQYASGAAVLLELVNGVVWAETASNQWYDDNGANWSSSTTAPPSGGTVQTASLTNLNTFAFPNLVINTTSPPPPSGPTVTSVVASGPGITTSNETGDLNVGAVVTFTVDMSAPVTVSGTPSFTLNDNGGVATYMSGSGSNALIFGYTVAAGQDTPTTGTPGLAITGYNANGATVSTGNPTITPGSGQTLVASDGTFSFGGATGGGNYVILRNGSQYASGAAALLELVNTTVWAETASNQWYEDNGSYWTASSTAPPSGGTVQTASLTNLNTFAFPNLVINTTSPPPPSGPTVTSVVASGPGITTSNETGDLNVGAVVTFTVDMSAPVTVSGTPSFTLNDNGGVATYMSGSGSNALIFGYTVAAGQDTPTTGTPGLAITGYVANGATVSTGNPTITPGSGQTLVASDGTFSFGGATGGGNYVILRNGSQYASGAAVLLELVNGVVWAETASNQWYDDNGANWSSSTTAPPSGGTVQTASLTNLNTFAFPNLVINTTSPPPPSGPTVTSVVAGGTGIANETGNLNVGAVVTFTVMMSGAVLVDGTPTMSLSDGGVATYAGGSGTDALTFSYTVAVGQETADLAITMVNLNGATVSTAPAIVTAGSGQSITDEDGNVFSFGGLEPGTSNYIILRNGVQFASGAAVILEWVNGTVWAYTAQNQWWSNNGSYWVEQASAPSIGTGSTADLSGVVTTFGGLQINTIPASIIKPNGLPTFLSSNPLAAGMLFYGVDLGNGTIVDVAGGNTMIAADPLPPNITTPYGTGIGWNNQAFIHGDGYYANVNNSIPGSAIQNAVNLANAGPGAGFTFGCTFVQLGPIINSVDAFQGTSPQSGVMIFGRPALAAEAPPYWNEAFTTAGGDDNTGVDLVLNNNGTPDVVGTYNFGSYGTLVSVICTVENTGAGSGIAKFFAASGNTPGALIATATVSAASTQDAENEIMFGSVYHVLTNYGWDSFNGPVFSGFIAGTAWTDAEALAWLSNPYELLSWNGDTPTPPLGTSSPDDYVWGVVQGSWDNAANWDDTSTGQSQASVAPGSNDIVTIGAAGSEVYEITGTGNSTALAIDGTTVLEGTFTTGMLTVNSASISVFNGSIVQLAGLTVATGAYVSLCDDSTSSVEIGTAGGVTAGSITIDAGMTTTVTGSFAAPSIVDDGAFVVAAGTGLTLDGSLSGSGRITISSDANLTVENNQGSTAATTAPTITFAGSGDALTINPNALNASGQFVPTLIGLNASDVINYDGTVTRASPSSNGTNTILTLYDNSTPVAILTLAGTGYAGNTFNTTAIGSGITQIVDPPAMDTINNGATFEIGSVSADVVTFAGTTGTLQLDQSQSFAGTVAGFGSYDQIDLRDIAFSANTTLGYAANGANSSGTLTASDGIHTANIALLGQYMAASFVAASDGHGGTMITDPAIVSQAQLAQPSA